MDVSVHSTCGQDVVEERAFWGGGLHDESWNSIKPSGSLICSSWLPVLHCDLLSVILDARKNTNLFFMAILMFCLNGSPLFKEENKPQLHLLNKREESLSYLLYEKHFLHSFLHVWIPYSLLTMKWLKLKRRKAHTFNLIFWHNSVAAPRTIKFEIINSWMQKLLWIAP